MQICSFVWVYYGYPASSYEGINVEDLFAAGAAEVHMRIACPTLIYPCDFLNFSTSRSTLDLAGRRAITELEGREDSDAEVMRAYATSGTPRHRAMVAAIRRHLHLTSLAYQSMDDLVAAIGLPKEKLCTHCWDGSSHFGSPAIAFLSCMR